MVKSWWWWLLWWSLLEKECSNCVWNSLVFSYLASMSGVVCVVCAFVDDEKHSCRSSVISMRSCPPQYPRSSTSLNSSPSLFLFFLSFFFSPPFSRIFPFFSLFVLSFFLLSFFPDPTFFFVWVFLLSFSFFSYLSTFFFFCVCACLCVYPVCTCVRIWQFHVCRPRYDYKINKMKHMWNI